MAIQENYFPSAPAAQDGEAARNPSPGFLSVLLFSPFTVLVVGGLLFLGLIRIPLSYTSLASPAQQPAPVSAPVESASIAPLFTPQVQHWSAEIAAWAAAQDLDPNLVATVMQIESCGNPRALSPAGAIGLFQVMPYHFAAADDPYTPATNASRGLAYLSRSLAAFDGNPALALAGYNGGINGASRPQSEWASETVDYLYWGSGIYAAAASGAAASDVLDEWLAAGGASLCAQASSQQLAAQ